MLLYHIAYHMPKRPGETIIRAEALDFPGIALEGRDLSDTRRRIERELHSAAAAYRLSGIELPRPNPGADSPDAEILEIIAIPASA